MDSTVVTVLQYVVPVIIGALIAGIVNVIPYFRARKDTEKEKADALLASTTAAKSTAETARIMYDGLATRVEQLERENSELRKQLTIMFDKNAYIVDLESTKYEMEQQVHELSGRINTLEKSLHIVIDVVRGYMKEPTKLNAYNTNILLNEIEGQTYGRNSQRSNE